MTALGGLLDVLLMPTSRLDPGLKAMSKFALISQDTAASAIERALRLRIGRGRQYSFASVADATGIAPRTLESYVQGAAPGLPAFLSLCAALGPGFTSDVLSVCGQVAHEADINEPEHMKCLTALTRLSADLAEAVSDGHVDHREAAALRPQAQRLIEILEPLARSQT